MGKAAKNKQPFIKTMPQINALGLYDEILTAISNAQSKLKKERENTRKTQPHELLPIELFALDLLFSLKAHV